MKKLGLWIFLALSVSLTIFIVIISISNQKNEIKRQHDNFVQDSMDCRKWIVDTIQNKKDTFYVVAHNKFVPKLYVKYIMNKKPTFSINDTIDNLIK